MARAPRPCLGVSKGEQTMNYQNWARSYHQIMLSLFPGNNQQERDDGDPMNHATTSHTPFRLCTSQPHDMYLPSPLAAKFTETIRCMPYLLFVQHCEIGLSTKKQKKNNSSPRPVW
ncbi:hypothetical protein CI238_04437 [Colletotrichum incanum]|uniref:Uncharacterized protein n=1 Tax=Colletotrichum incanum TaxID=1573173 RepID=A0A166LYZ8_COLIC|nr:hypothetical protein CI238_04437 [Colletotrichum incanum]